MKRILSTLVLLMVLPLFSIGQDFTITDSDRGHISLHFELGDYSIDTVVVDGEIMHSIVTKGIVVPNEYGLPALPTFNRFIAIPHPESQRRCHRSLQPWCLYCATPRPWLDTEMVPAPDPCQRLQRHQ